MTGITELRPLGHALGTEALGIDLSKPLDDETFAWIKRAFAEHPVLVFRDQKLGAAELAAFGRRFGKPRPHSLVDYRHDQRAVAQSDERRGVDAVGEGRWNSLSWSKR